jgi:hypothetical protein
MSNFHGSVSQVACLSMQKFFASNEVVRKLMNVAMQFVIHAAPQVTRGGVLKSTVEHSKIVETILTILRNPSSSDARNVEVSSLCLKALQGIVETGAAVSLHENICVFLLELFTSSRSLRFSVGDFLKSHFSAAMALSKTMLKIAVTETQESVGKLLIALLEHAKMRKDSSASVLFAICDIAEVKKYDFSPEVIALTQQQAIEAISNDSGSLLMSALSCIWSISNFCKCELDRVSPQLLLECFKKSAQTQPPDFEVCNQILKIAALFAKLNQHKQFSEMLELGICFLSGDCGDSAFVEALAALSVVQSDAPAIVEKLVIQATTVPAGSTFFDADDKVSKKMKSASSGCSLPSFLSFLYGYVDHSHRFRSCIVGLVKICLQTPGTACIFGMQCLQYIPHRVDQLVSCFSDEMDVVLSAFASMNSDLGENSRAIHNATAAFLLVHDSFAPKLFGIVRAAVEAMMQASSDQSLALALVLPKFLCLRKILGEWIEHSILKIVDGQIRWNGSIPSRDALIQSILDLCFQFLQSSDGAFPAISTVCVGILGIGLFLDFRGVDGDCPVLNFALKDRVKFQAIILDVVLASMSNSNQGSSLNRDGMSQAINDSTIHMLRLFSIDVLPPASSVPELSVPQLTGSDMNTKLFKSALSSCITCVETLGSSITFDLFQAIATGACEFLQRFSCCVPSSAQPYGGSVQIWKAWEAFGKSQASWPTLMVKAAIRKDDSIDGQGYTLRDFTYSLRSLALNLLSKLLSAEVFHKQHPGLMKLILQCTVSHLDDFRPEGSSASHTRFCNRSLFYRLTSCICSF